MPRGTQSLARAEKRQRVKERQERYRRGDNRTSPLTTVGSITEAMFREQAAEAGWTVSKRGWPDFILRRGNEVCFVETKTYPGTNLKKDQQEIAEVLAAAGLKVYRWDPETGFTRIKRKG